MRQLLCLSLVLLAACQPTVDNSDTDALAESVGEMAESRPAADRAVLADALAVIALSETGYLGTPPTDPVEIAKDATLGPALLGVLDGDDYEDIIEKAAVLRKSREERAVQAAQLAQQEVKAKLEQAKAELAQLRDVGIQNAQYSWTTGDYMPQAVVEFELINRTDQAVTGVKLRGTLVSSERSEPWVHEVLTHELIRPLPGQSLEHYRLVPNQFSAWGNRQLQRRRDLRLSFEVINVRKGDDWLVSADPEQLAAELRHYEDAELQARAALTAIKGQQLEK
ncbi:hypothetical protein HPT27_00130 [Permianibacter sp. IMCC34836]|uniref:hypothetical protein n=1 Tax=Permianibacter fluminis TaxID=2738515 RepID=UPI0015518B47|nr:hypothetical protein [Permianibacter fluminis]NQD35407.1 hypothetical protein [Permianibacter fluminis]